MSSLYVSSNLSVLQSFAWSHFLRAMTFGFVNNVLNAELTLSMTGNFDLRRQTVIGSGLILFVVEFKGGGRGLCPAVDSYRLIMMF